MEKEKREKLILLMLLPIFIFALAFKVMGKANKEKEAVPAAAVITSEQLQPQTMEAIKPPEAVHKTVEYTGANSPDPLKDRFNIFMTSFTPKISNLAAEEVMKQFDTSNMDIKGLIWNSDRPQAIINEQVISIGDEVNGAKLLSVNRDGIKLQYKGVEFLVDKNKQKKIL